MVSTNRKHYRRQRSMIHKLEKLNIQGRKRQTAPSQNNVPISSSVAQTDNKSNSAFATAQANDHPEQAASTNVGESNATQLTIGNVSSIIPNSTGSTMNYLVRNPATITVASSSHATNEAEQSVCSATEELKPYEHRSSLHHPLQSQSDDLGFYDPLEMKIPQTLYLTERQWESVHQFIRRGFRWEHSGQSQHMDVE